MNRRLLGYVAPLAAAVVAGAVVVALAFGSSSAPRARRAPAVSPPPSAVALQNAIVNVVRAVSPSVVQIERQGGLGSGIVFDGKGNIVTNYHVVQGATSFTVTASNGKRYPAKLVGSFPPDDLAVIRVSGANLRAARFERARVRVGDIAIAIGNPLGLRSSVTEGIVSAFRVAVPEGNGVTLPAAIQTSAAINPGNSGGALVDIQGRVIGIPTLAAADPQLGGGAAPGIGFAIPSSIVTDIAGQLVANGKVLNSHRAYLGVYIADSGEGGVLVTRLTPGGPAAKAGIAVGDAIVSVAGRSTPDSDALASVLATLKPGQTVQIVVRRQSGSRSTLRATLGEFPAG